MDNFLRSLLDMMNQLGKPDPVPQPEPQQESAGQRWFNGQGQNFAQPGQQQPQQQGMTQPGNIDLAHRPLVYNKDGSYSTVRSAGGNINGKEVLYPTVSDQGYIMSPREAYETAKRTGKNLGTFATPEDSDRYAQSLHEDQAGQYSKMAREHQPTVGPPQPMVANNPRLAPIPGPSIGPDPGVRRGAPTGQMQPGPGFPMDFGGQASFQPQQSVGPDPGQRRGGEAGQESHPDVFADHVTIEHPNGSKMKIPGEVFKHIMKNKKKRS